MSYYTDYSLEVSNETEEFLTFIKTYDSEYGVGFFSELLNFAHNLKWHEHEEEMTILSSKFPDILFTLSGHGEESGDMWKKYFKGGIMQRADAEIVYPKCNL